MKFARYDVAAALGLTPIATVQDKDIWNHFLTPQVRALLGKVTKRGEPEVFETIKGHFPGDEAANLNLHRLYAGSNDHVRFPYVSTLHMTEFGALVIKRDAVKVKAEAWVGDVMSGKAEMIFLAALRDRRFDGTRRANDSALLAYTYEDPKYHRKLHQELNTVELSIYSFVPGSRVLDTTGDVDLDKFFQKPFRFIKEPEKFRKLFDYAWHKTNRGPGQFAAPIRDVSKLVLAGFEKVAASKKYDAVEAAVSHYHVARWSQSHGYRFTYNCDVETMDTFAEGIKRVKDDFAAKGIKLSRQQESWICVVQSLRPVEMIPDGLYLNGPQWPQDNITPPLLWMHKPLTEKAKSLVPGPVDFCSTKRD
jgi:hypothetical protein